MRRLTVRSFVCAVFLTAVVLTLTGLPTWARADAVSDLQAEADEAGAHLDSLYSDAADLGQQLLQTQEDLDTINAELEHKQAERTKVQAQLAQRASQTYKGGGISVLSVLSSSSISEAVSRLVYAAKVSDSDARLIQQAKDIEADLAATQDKQKQLLSDLQAQKSASDEKIAEAQAYKDSLDAQVQEALAQQEAARQAEQERARQQAQQQAEQAGGYVTQDTTSAPAINTGAGGGGSTSTDGGASSSGDDSSGSGLTQAQRNAIVDAAWDEVGDKYEWGASNPGDSFDCSGLVQYCYAQAGISLSHSSFSQSSWGRGTSSPQAGDIVAYGHHVGIYIGDGMMIDAGNESVGVSYRSIYGSPWFRTL